MTMDDSKIKIGITQGDINGIGYEIILKTLSDERIAELCTPILYGSAKIAAYYRKALELPEIRFQRIDSPQQAIESKNYIINVVPEDTPVQPGQPTPQGGEAAFKALERATDDLSQGLIDAMVTAPINKATIQSDTFHFPGHTEYLESKLARDGENALMVMTADDLRVALVTTHTPIGELTGRITPGLVTQRILQLQESLIRDFGIHSPRIAVLSLNPHAGDGGLIGTEDETIVKPAIEEANRKKCITFGPYPADGFFASDAFRKFDGIVAMYHDQGLIPFKLIARNNGINYTAGLRGIRTSPDHGTAFDIAARGVADEQSLRQAIYAAIDIYRNRARHAMATANPLKKQHFDKNGDRNENTRQER